MNAIMMNKVNEAKAMMNEVARLGYLTNNKFFTPHEYEGYRIQWDKTTPAWSTLVKYAQEIGLNSEEVEFHYHSDGSMLDLLANIPVDMTYTHKMYYFA